MKRFANYNTESGLVGNVIVYDGQDELELEAGTDLIELEDDSLVGIGWTVNSDGAFTEPPAPPTFPYAVCKRIDGEVVAIIEAESQPPETFDLGFVKCTEEVQVGWFYKYGRFSVDGAPPGSGE